MKRILLGAGLALAVLLLLMPHAALAQSLTIDLGNGDGSPASGSATGRIVQLLLLLTVLSLAPAILITVTSFTRIIVVLSFLRNALGTQTDAAQYRAGQPGALSHRLRHGADARELPTTTASRR